MRVFVVAMRLLEERIPLEDNRRDDDADADNPSRIVRVVSWR